MKKLLLVALVLAIAMALAVPALATTLSEDPIARTVGFHCNANGSNGNVNIADYAGGLETFTYTDDGFWKLDCEDYVCTKCGNSVWFAYSNQGGDLNGDNVQVNHGGDYIVDYRYEESSPVLEIMYNLDFRSDPPVIYVTPIITETTMWTKTTIAIWNSGKETVVSVDPIIKVETISKELGFKTGTEDIEFDFDKYHVKVKYSGNKLMSFSIVPN